MTLLRASSLLAAVALALPAPQALGQAPASTFTYQSADLPGKILAMDADTAVLEVIVGFSLTGFRVMTRSAGTWAEEAFIAAPGDLGDFLNATAALDGDTLLIGAPHDDSDATGVNGDELNNSTFEAGAAYVFVRVGTTWSQQAYLKASNTNLLDRFGEAVTLSGDTIAIGSAFEDSASTGLNGNDLDNSAESVGAAYIFQRTGTTWVQSDYVKASNAEAGDNFGTAVALSGDTLVVTATGEDNQIPGVNVFEGANGKSNSGAAYVFTRTAGVWSQQAYIKPSNPSKEDRFGEQAAINGDLVAISTTHERSAAQGVDGDQLDESAPDSGAAYAFERTGSTWAQTAYFKASNTDANEAFGSSLAVFGQQVLVVAAFERGMTDGIDSPYQDFKGFPTPDRTGAAYLFENSGTAWSQKHYIKGEPSLSAYGEPRGTLQAGEFSVGHSVFDQAATTGMRRYGVPGGANSIDLYLRGAPAVGATVVVETLKTPLFTPGSGGFLMISAAPADIAGFLGGTLLIDPSQSFSGTTPLLSLPLSGGSSQIQIPVTIPAGTAGMSFYCQAFFYGPGFQNELAMTSGLAMTIQP